MKTRTTTILLFSGLLSVACIVAPGLVRGQAPAGPLPPAQPVPRTQAPAQMKEQEPQPPQEKLNLSGNWKLNRDESDDARKKMQEARGGSGDRNGGGSSGGGGRVGGGYPYPGSGGGRGPYGGHRGGTREGTGDEGRQRMHGLFTPANSLTIAQKDAEVDLTDDQSRKSVFYTDGRQVQTSTDDKYQEMAAHWEGSRLVSEEKGARDGKIVRTFELAPGGQRLYETLKLDNSRSGSPVVIRYVYDIVRENKE